MSWSLLGLSQLTPFNWEEPEAAQRPNESEAPQSSDKKGKDEDKDRADEEDEDEEESEATSTEDVPSTHTRFFPAAISPGLSFSTKKIVP